MRRPPTSGGAAAIVAGSTPREGETAALSHSTSPNPPFKQCDCVLLVNPTTKTTATTYSYQYYYDCRCTDIITNISGRKNRKREQIVTSENKFFNHLPNQQQTKTTSNYFKQSRQNNQTITSRRPTKLIAPALAPKSAFYYLLTLCVPPTLMIASLLFCATLLFATTITSNFNSVAAIPASNQHHHYHHDEALIPHPHDHNRRHHHAVAQELHRGQTHPDGYHSSSSSSSSASPLGKSWTPLVRYHHDQTESPATRRQHRTNNINEKNVRHPREHHERLHHANQHRNHWDRKMRSRPTTTTTTTKSQKAEPHTSKQDGEVEMSLAESLRNGPLSRFFTSGARFTADNEIDSYNVDDIFNNDDTDGDLDFDDLEDDDDDDDDEDEEDFIDDDIEDEEEEDLVDFGDNSIGLNNDIEFESDIIASSSNHNLRKSHQHPKESNGDKVSRHQKNVIDRHQTDSHSRRLKGYLANMKSHSSEPQKRHEKSSSSTSSPQHIKIVSANSKPESHHYYHHQKQPSSRVSAAVAPALGPHLPYQSPIVVSISDNSYVSASPVVSTPENVYLYNDGRVYNNVYDQPIVENEFGNKNNKNNNRINMLTTSTTATTTSSSRNSYSISRADLDSSNDVNINNNSNNSQQTDLEEEENGNGIRAELTTIITPSAATTTIAAITQREKGQNNLGVRHSSSSSPIVFRKFDRYNFVVDGKQGHSHEQTAEQVHENDVINHKVRTNMIMSSNSNGEDNRALVEDQRITTTSTLSSSSSTPPPPSTMQPDNGVSIDIDLSEDDDGDAAAAVAEAAAAAVDDDEEEEDKDDEDFADSETSDTNRLLGRSAESVELSELMKLDEGGRQGGGGEVVTAKYSNLIISPKNELPSFTHRYWHDSHLASIQMVQEEPNELNQGGINSAIIAILFGIGAMGMLVLVVGLKMGTIRERVAYKGRRRSLVPDTDYLINTIPIIRSESQLQTLDRKVFQVDS